MSGASMRLCILTPDGRVLTLQLGKTWGYRFEEFIPSVDELLYAFALQLRKDIVEIDTNCRDITQDLCGLFGGIGQGVTVQGIGFQGGIDGLFWHRVDRVRASKFRYVQGWCVFRVFHACRCPQRTLQVSALRQVG